MRVLLDTHAFLWAITSDPRFSKRARTLFADEQVTLLLSVASVWEILLKVRVGKLPLPTPTGPFLEQQLLINSIHLLPIEMRHVLRVESLDMHHKDPFDRILVAQSMEESMPVVSGDSMLRAYGVPILW